MKRLRRRSRPAVVELESRLLPTGPSVAWIGQDGHDLTGRSSKLGPDGVQDIHITLANLPAGRTVAGAQVYGYGSGEWDYNGQAGHWAAALVQAPGAATADVFIEPSQVETGRSFAMVLDYDDGTTSGTLYFQGGTADPSLRMPSNSLQAGWVGQDGHDLTGPGPDVGPDGVQDVHVTLSQLSTYAAVQSIAVVDSAGTVWRYGVNLQGDNNAEFLVNPGNSAQGDLYFNPDANLAGQTLTITVGYADLTSAQTTVLAGATDPTAAVAPPAPVALTWNTVSATWLGQDGLYPAAPGFVHVALTGLPVGGTLNSVTLSDAANAAWSYRPGGGTDPLDPSAGALVFARGADPSTADVFFAPIRDETGTTLTITISLGDGSTLVTRFAGGASDPGLLSPGPAPTSVDAQPGDDLNALANSYGHVHLAAGTYLLDRPLVLNQAVAITADPGATLVFQQGLTDPTWSAAIKLNAGQITLDGFAVRFAGPVRWNPAVSYSPAVIGVRDNLDPPGTGPIEAITITHLDVQSPPAATAWEIEPSLMRLVNAQSGTVADNTLQGGTVEFFGGPWTITGNDFTGTVADTFTFCAIAGHYTHDVTIANNVDHPAPGVGKTWRFLVLTQQGIGDVVKDNTVVGVGPTDDDTVPNPNAPEVILTESYRLHFEGVPAAISAGGWVVQVPAAQNGDARTGDVLAVLSGPEAGQWRTVAQALGPNTYLLNAPIATGRFAVSITAGGFVDTTFAGNTVDTTGSSVTEDLVLAGNHFGTQVLDNTFIGGRNAFSITAYPTESPGAFGWSHAPFLGGVIAGNTIQDSLEGGVLDVTSGAPVKSSAGRVYFSAALNDNTVVYTSAFLAGLAAQGVSTPPPGIRVGDGSGLDPAELVLTASGNQAELPPGAGSWPTLRIDAGTVNGVATTAQNVVLPVALPLTLPSAPSGLRLVVNAAAGIPDGITSDTRLQWVAAPDATGYEYSLTGADGTYLPAATPGAFQPAGLAPGFNVVFVRAYNAAGARGPAAAIAFVYDASLASLASTGQGASRPSSYAYRVGASGAYAPLGVATVPDASAFAAGAPVLQLQTTGVVGGVIAAQPEVTAGATAPALKADNAVSAVTVPGPCSFPSSSPPIPVFKRPFRAVRRAKHWVAPERRGHEAPAVRPKETHPGVRRPDVRQGRRSRPFGGARTAR